MYFRAYDPVTSVFAAEGQRFTNSNSNYFGYNFAVNREGNLLAMVLINSGINTV